MNTSNVCLLDKLNSGDVLNMSEEEYAKIFDYHELRTKFIRAYNNLNKRIYEKQLPLYCIHVICKNLRKINLCSNNIFSYTSYLSTQSACNMIGEQICKFIEIVIKNKENSFNDLLKDFYNNFINGEQIPIFNGNGELVKYYNPMSVSVGFFCMLLNNELIQDEEIFNMLLLFSLVVFKHLKFNSMYDILICKRCKTHDKPIILSETNKEIIFKLLHLNEIHQNAYKGIIKIVPKNEYENIYYLLNNIDSHKQQHLHKNEFNIMLNNIILTKNVPIYYRLVETIQIKEAVLLEDYLKFSLLFICGGASLYYIGLNMPYHLKRDENSNIYFINPIIIQDDY